ncbi:sensor histidine kinase [Streptomyces sp. NPDC102274]|uniref:sensor histidine kinase n=1 Tax=Streptomyces sp. NPDC102274 TaxID=3366151 RepID=UPI0037F723C0
MKAVVRRGLRLAAGLLIGSGAAAIELLFTLLVGIALLLVLAWPRGRRAVMRPLAAGAGKLVEMERHRLRTLLGERVAGTYEPVGALRYLAVRWALGVLGAVVLLSVIIGAAYCTFFFYGWLIVDIRDPGTVALGTLGGLFLLFLAMQGIFGVAALEGNLARHFLGPSHQEELERRIEQLATSRAGVVDAVHDERRRIERDLHDGVQQRLVALGMLLGRARRSGDPERADDLLRQAHEQSREALTELREVAWRVYPTVLDEAGLRAALETVAERSSLPVRLKCVLKQEPGKAAANVAYFVVSESVTNAVKHSEAPHIDVEVVEEARTLRIRVRDYGRGGADPEGSGLFGLSRRVAALDGLLQIKSPLGGPTTITAEIPCE